MTSTRSATTSSGSPSGSPRARAASVELDDPIERLSGAGPVTAARLGQRGFVRVRDLLVFFPRGYDDYRRVYRLGELGALPDGTAVVVRGKVVRLHRFFRRLLDVYLEQDGVRLRARWFRPNAGMAKTYARGSDVALAGRLRRADDGMPELVHPSNVTAALAEPGGVGIRPRYPLIAKVPGRTLERLVSAALEVARRDATETLPAELRQRLGLPTLVEALDQIHRPSGADALDLASLMDGSSPAQRRIAFEELYVLQLALARERAALRGQPGFPCRVPAARTIHALQAAVPFRLTPAQLRAVTALCESMAGPAPMQCLLQGDVGSGKTAVVFGACLAARESAGQTLLMAPTTVLAEQHYRTLRAWGEGGGVRVGLLHGALGREAQADVLARAAAGQVDVLVGTHALLESRLRLARLALAVVDEQHRFGVRQRAALRRAGAGENGWNLTAQDGMVPHLLVLSATPIPRSLALTLYGDLDLVTLEAPPPGRKPVATYVCRDDLSHDAAYQAVRAAVGRGEQAFVICPAIDEADDVRRTSAVVLARELRHTLAPARVGVLHGRLPGPRQQAVAEAFAAHRLDVVVATTVVEVGIDVASASVIVIEDAECLGLAQLHQLRGRVGRGGQQASCHLVTRSTDAIALDRLALLAEVSDGFRLAEEDLRRRGAGDVHGTRQTGTPELRFADPGLYLGLLDAARSEAVSLLGGDPELALPEHQALARAVAERMRRGRPIADEAG